MYEIKSRRLYSQIVTFFFQYYFQKNNHGFVKIATLQKKCHSCIDIGNLEDSPRLVFIDQECGKLIVVNDSAELTMNINQKKKPDVLQQPIDVYSVTNVAGESILSVTMWNIYCELVMHDFSCEFYYRVNMKDRKRFSDQMNRNGFDPVVARRDRSCSTMQNLNALTLL